MYDDEYPTCAETYATFRIDPGDIDPSVITERLGIAPSRWQRRGEVISRAGQPSRIASINGWFLESRGNVASKDARRHIDWLLDRLASRAEAIRSLQRAGCRMDICCYWLSRSGHGGPIVSPSQMKGLVELDIELGFDIYG